MEDDDRPLPRGESAARLSGENLESHSLAELDQRIALLETEIERVKAHKAKASAHLQAAAALFRPRENG